MIPFELTDTHFKKLLNLLPPLDLVKGPWIAGGAVRKIYQNLPWEKGDIDVFFRDDHQRQEWTRDFEHRLRSSKSVGLLDSINLFEKPETGASIYMRTTNADTWVVNLTRGSSYEIKLQLIKIKYSQSLAQLWNTFDFTVCQFATDGRYIFASERAVSDLNDNQLVLIDENNSKCLPLRVFKYFTYGLNVSDELLIASAQTIAQEGISWDLADQY